MGESGLDIQKIISVAVEAAVAAGLTGMDEKIEAAINLAMPIALQVGAEVGAKIGAEAGATAAVRAIERERKAYRKKQYDWKYHNTKLLLRNYRRLNAYYQNAVFSRDNAGEADVDFEDIMRSMGRPADEEIFVESIQKNYITTRIIMAHVNKNATRSCARGRTERTTKGTGACWRGFTLRRTTPRRRRLPRESASTNALFTRILTYARRI